MHKLLLFLVVLWFTIISCSTDSRVEQYVYNRDTPVWLKAKIDSMYTDLHYRGSVVYRYELHGNFVYHIEIPISSCAYCDLFDNTGRQLDHTNEEIIADFIQNRYNEFVVWAWKE